MYNFACYNACSGKVGKRLPTIFFYQASFASYASKRIIVELTQPKKTHIPIILFLVGVAFVTFGQSLIAAYPQEQHANMLFVTFFGLALVTLAVLLIKNPHLAWLNSILSWADNHSIKSWQVFCLILSLPVAVIVPFAAGSGSMMIDPLVAILAWLIAIGLVLAGACTLAAPLRWPSWRLVTLALGFTFIAFLLRVVFVDRIPIMLTGDEGSAGLAAEEFLHGTWNNIFTTSWFAFPSFFFTIPAFFIGLFGHTTEALRIPSALAGALTVTATFFVARAMFGNRAAWFSAIFLAVLHFHIHFSRIGLNNIWDGLWYIVTIGALWYGWEKNIRNAFVLAGLTLGISQFFYSSSHTLLILVLGWIILTAIFDRARLKRSWVNILIMLCIAAIIILPLAWHYFKFPNTFLEPMDRVALTPAWVKFQASNTGAPIWKVVLKQAESALGSYTYSPLQAWYTPGVPLLRPFAAGLFLMGILLLVLRKGKWQIIPILLWLSAFILIGGLSESTPAAQRLVAAAPVCALMVGFGLSESAGLIENEFEKRKRWISAAAIIVIAILAANELYFYFKVYTSRISISEAQSNGVIAQSLANYLETRPKDTQVIFFGAPNMGFYSVPSIQFLVPEISGIDINEAWQEADMKNITSHHLLFVFLINNVDQVPAVRADYPGGKLTSVPALNGNLLYEKYEVTLSP